MKLTRRTLMSGAGAAAGLATLPRRVWANTSLQMGDMQLDTLSDGSLVLPGDFILGPMPEEEAREILARYDLETDQLTPDCNVTLLRTGDRTVLFDVGAGANFMPSAGYLREALEAAGVDPFDVTDVVFTHAHPDHLWGVLDDFGDLTFPEARYYMGAVERDYWLDPATVDTIGEARMAFAAGAVNNLSAIGEALEVFEDGDEILPGVTARATYGHTPGHMAFEVGNGDGAAMVLGDCIGNHHVAFERPDWLSGSDQDLEMGAATRVELLAKLAETGMPIVGFHLPAPGIGVAEAADRGYRFRAA